MFDWKNIDPISISISFTITPIAQIFFCNPRTVSYKNLFGPYKKRRLGGCPTDSSSLWRFSFSDDPLRYPSIKIISGTVIKAVQLRKIWYIWSFPNFAILEIRMSFRAKDLSTFFDIKCSGSNKFQIWSKKLTFDFFAFDHARKIWSPTCIWGSLIVNPSLVILQLVINSGNNIRFPFWCECPIYTRYN